MGGCCCCLPRKSALERETIYGHDLEINEPLSSTHDTLSAAPVPVNPILGLSVSNDSHEPNAFHPLVDLTNTQANTRSTENHASKNEPRQPTVSLPTGQAVDGSRFEEPDMSRGSNEAESKNISELISNSPKMKDEHSKLDALFTLTEEEDVCPTCLEEYDAENPRVITKCKHHFHLSCILEWLERSDTCAICDKIMEVEGVVMMGQAL